MRNNPLFKSIAITSLCLCFQINIAHSSNATTKTKHSSKAVKHALRIYPGKTHEECIQVTQKQELPYQFSSSEKLMFNIHYHSDQGVIYPIPEQAMTSLSGILKPQTEQRYCLMWVNTSQETVKLSVKYKISDIQATKNK